MCLIDGSVGGALFASHDFGRIDVKNRLDGTLRKEPVDIKTMITEAVHVYANEPYENIILNDLDDVAVELLDYKIENQSCFIYDVGEEVSRKIINSQPIGDPIDYTGHYDTNVAFSKEEVFNFLLSHYTEGIEGIIIPTPFNNKYLRIIKYLRYGDTAGYRRTDLIYPSEDGSLIIDAGGTIGDLLKKITEAFGEYEYFYDVYGRFIFQRKRIYHNVVWNGTVPDENTSVGYFTSSESS